MTAEQWLADLEARAKAATPGPWEIGVCLDMGTVRQRDGSILADCRLTTDDGIHNAAFIAAANPATVLRLVGMVRWLAAQRQELLSGYCPEDMRVGCLGNCIDCRHGQIAIKSAYAATEAKMKKEAQ